MFHRLREAWLMRLGVPWEAVQSMTGGEVSEVLATHAMLVKQEAREAELDAWQSRVDMTKGLGVKQSRAFMDDAQAGWFDG